MCVCVLSVFVSVPRYIYHACVCVTFTRDPIPSKGTVACAVCICLSIIEVIDCGLLLPGESQKSTALTNAIPFGIVYI